MPPRRRRSADRDRGEFHDQDRDYDPEDRRDREMDEMRQLIEGLTQTVQQMRQDWHPGVPPPQAAPPPPPQAMPPPPQYAMPPPPPYAMPGAPVEVHDPYRVEYMAVLRQMQHLETTPFRGGSGRPIDAENWVRMLKKNFETAMCPDVFRVAIARHYLRDDADRW